MSLHVLSNLAFFVCVFAVWFPISAKSVKSRWIDEPKRIAINWFVRCLFVCSFVVVFVAFCLLSCCVCCLVSCVVSIGCLPDLDVDSMYVDGFVDAVGIGTSSHRCRPQVRRCNFCSRSSMLFVVVLNRQMVLKRLQWMAEKIPKEVNSSLCAYVRTLFAYGLFDGSFVSFVFCFRSVCSLVHAVVCQLCAEIRTRHIKGQSINNETLAIAAAQDESRGLLPRLGRNDYMQTTKRLMN